MDEWVLSESKRLLRKEKRAARAALPPAERAERSARIAAHIAAAPEFQRARTVLLYRATGDEADLSSLTALAPEKRYCYPRCLPDGNLEALIPAGEEAWVPGLHGNPEPDPARSRPVPPEELDLVLCPCLGFDATGRRLGVGGGCFDRFLPGCVNAVPALAAFEVQREHIIPVGRDDRSVRLVCTEAGVVPARHDEGSPKAVAAPLEWTHVSGRTDAVRIGAALVPVWHAGGGEVVLIDSGAEKCPALPEELRRRGLCVKAILCTHAHPDHIANNHLLHEAFGCPVYVHPVEWQWAIERFGDASPLSARRYDLRFDYPTRPLTGAELLLDGERFRLIWTPGHSDAHQCVVTPDGVCCLGDALISPDSLRRTKLPYMEDADLAVASMETLRGLDCAWFTAAHLGCFPREELDAVIDANIRKELEIYDAARALVTGPMPLEEAVTELMRRVGIRSPLTMQIPGMRLSSGGRFRSLARAGELVIEGDTVRPNRKNN